MKALLITVSLLVSTLAMANEPARCMIKSGLGDAVIGVGSSKTIAQSNAATKCFDKHLDAYQIAKGQLPDDDAAGEIMNACVNATCL
jgi:hypothetical protein